MVVGLCEFSLSLPGNRSLKGKRKVVRGLVDRLRARHRISVAEVGAQDTHDVGVVGFAVVGGDGGTVRTMVNAVLQTVHETCEADVVDEEIEVMGW